MATRIKAKSKSSKSRKPAKVAKAKTAGKDRRPDGLLVSSDAAKLVDAICAKQGATHAELKKMIGWKSCLPYAMKSCATAKIKLRKVRQGREVRFFGGAR